MKRCFLLVSIFILTLTSCSVENEERQEFYLSVLPIESVEMPKQFVLGKTYEINVTYYRPTSCYEFNDFYYEVNGNEKTIAVINTVYTDVNCDTTAEKVTVSFIYVATENDTSKFKFYQGEDANGKDKYQKLVVSVTDGKTIKNDVGDIK
jgi:hypothetical protein